MVCILPKYGHRLTSIYSKPNAQIFEPGHETTKNIKARKSIKEINNNTIASDYLPMSSSLETKIILQSDLKGKIKHETWPFFRHSKY